MSEPLTVAIEIDDPALAARMTELLSQLPGLRIAGPGKMADLVLAPAESVDSAGALSTISNTGTILGGAGGAGGGRYFGPGLYTGPYDAPGGADGYLMTGTCLVPDDFTLNEGDEVEISIDGPGTLVNTIGVNPKGR